MMIMNLFESPVPPAIPVDAVFFTFLAPFIVFVLVKRFSDRVKKLTPNALPLLQVFGLTASGFFLWMLA